MIPIVKGLPPNFEEIFKVFPRARGVNVVFAYEPNIYTLSGQMLTHELAVHEKVHIDRQRAMGVKAWWDKYLVDRQFRWEEELLAHRAEYAELCRVLPIKAKRDKALKHVARKLASGLYNNMVTVKQAKEFLDVGGIRGDSQDDRRVGEERQLLPERGDAG